MTAPAFVDVGALTNISNSGNIPRPAIATDDTLLMVVVTAYGDATTATPAGWTHAGGVNQNSAFEPEVNVYRRRVADAGTEAANYAVSISGQGGGNNVGYGTILAYRGVDAATPINVVVTQRNTGASTSAQCPSVTTTVADTRLIAIYVPANVNSAQSWTPPAGMTERVDGRLTPTGYTLGIADEAVAAVGATGTRTATFSTSATTNVITLALGGPVPAPELSGTVTLDDVVAAGTLGSSAADLSGGVALDPVVASGTLGAQPGTITLGVVNGGNSPQPGITIPRLTVQRADTGAQVLVLNDQVLDGAAALAITNAALVPGTWYVVTAWHTDRSKAGIWFKQAA